MARIRSIKPETWTDEKIVSLSPLARLLFIGMWNFADDDGRMPYSPITIKLQVLPADSADVSELLGEIRGKGMIVVYRVDGKEYLQIVNFGRHQKIDKRSPSKFPEQPVVTPNSPDLLRIPTTEGKGMEGIKEGKGSTATAPDAARRPPKVNGSRIEFDHLQGVFKGITEDQELRWQEAYPAVPIPPAIAQAAAWLQANPANRKSNNERFLVNWFKRDQDKAARVRR